MPTATERAAPAATAGASRRGALQRLGLAAVWGLAPTIWPGSGGAAPARAAPPTLAACWDDVQGRHHAGWLVLAPRADRAGPAEWRVRNAVELPTRGHGLATLPDGSLLVVARRPGDWLVRLSLGRPPQWLWAEPGRVFSGHVLCAPDGQTLFTTEIDVDSGLGLLGVRDAHRLDKRAEFPTQGRDPHAVSVWPGMGQGAGGGAHPLAGALFVANGGIDTVVESGRTKRHLAQMDPSVVCLHPTTGEPLGQWRLPDPRLSLRHLAWACPPAGSPSEASPEWPRLGVALQAEHDDPAQRAAAPLLAVLDWQREPAGCLLSASGQPALAGYGGDVAVVNGRQFVVSATRGNALACYALDGRFEGAQPWAEAGALAARPAPPQGATVWAGGRDGAVQVADASAAGHPGAEATARFAHGRIDNHWLSV